MSYTFFESACGKVPSVLNASTRNLVAIEAYSAGIDVYLAKREGESTRKFVLSDGIKYCEYSGATGGLTTRSAINTCKDKVETKRLIQEAGVKTPGWKEIDFSHPNFNPVKVLDAVDRDIEFPVVFKPRSGIKGRGVVVGIADRHALSEVIEKHSKTGGQYLIEEQVDGTEYRGFVISGKCMALLKRVPPEVIGDGVNNISELIRVYNNKRKKNPHLRSRLIGFSAAKEYLKSTGLSLDCIPASGQVVRVSSAGNFSVGGMSVDVCPEEHADIAAPASNAVDQIKGLQYAGVDLIANSQGQVYVIEINHNPAIGSHHFPAVGTPRNIAREILRSYFPDREDGYSHDLYFDYRKLRSCLETEGVGSVKVLRKPESLVSKKITIKGSVQNKGYRRFIRKCAFSLGVHGVVENQKDGDVLVWTCCREPELLEFVKKIGAGNKRAIVESLETSAWDGPLMFGFKVVRKNGKGKKKNRVSKYPNKGIIYRVKRLARKSFGL